MDWQIFENPCIYSDFKSLRICGFIYDLKSLIISKFTYVKSLNNAFNDCQDC